MSDSKPFATEPAATPPVDLSREIASQIEKLPDDQVTCRRIYGDNYRCNWWSAASASKYDNPAMDGLLVTTHRVRKSRFLHVTKTVTGLVITGQE